MRLLARSSLVALALATGACYHQIVTTGRTPGTTVVEKPWTSTFIFGLVPAQEINTAAQCPNGVATVETQQTFLNGLVGALTLGIYTPQDVRITCATGSAAIPGAREIHVGGTGSLEARREAIARAVELAERTGNRVVVRY
jgi:hypothetical protein